MIVYLNGGLTLNEAREQSPYVFEMFRQLTVDFHAVPWSGTVQSLDKFEPGVICTDDEASVRHLVPTLLQRDFLVVCKDNLLHSGGPVPADAAHAREPMFGFIKRVLAKTYA